MPRRSIRRSLTYLVACLAACLVALSATAAPGGSTPRWMGPDGPLPFESADEILDFLQNAEVVGEKELASGSTKPWRLDLEKDGVRARAIFRTIDSELGRDFRKLEDHFRHEVAAYEVARLLGLELVPPATLRTWHGDRGSIQLWIENARSETERIEANISHGDREWIETLKERMHVFDALIYNFDRNTGNLLFDVTGRLWLVDHTRAFKPEGHLPEDFDLERCERDLWIALRDLDKKELKQATRSYLGPFQTAALVERLDALRAHYSQLIESRGEDAVLYDLP